MDKMLTLQLIIDVLQQDLDALQKAVNLAHEGATHPESKAENKYDTRGLEASYLAHGQAQRAADIAMALKNYQQFLSKATHTSDQVAIGSLLEIEDEQGASRWIWFGAEEGGLKVMSDDKLVTVVTPYSPLGKVLQGRLQGDFIVLKIEGASQEFEILKLL